MNIRKPLIRFLSDQRGVSAIEFAFVTPAFLLLTGLVLVAGEGFAIQRKVNMAARTLVDLAARQTDYKSGARSFNASDILNAASLLMTPYDSAGLGMVLSEMHVSNYKSTWIEFSAASGAATPLASGNYTLPNLFDYGVSFNTRTYMLMGTVTYTFQPFGVSNYIPPITLSRTLYMSARVFDTNNAAPD